MVDGLTGAPVIAGESVDCVVIARNICVPFLLDVGIRCLVLAFSASSLSGKILRTCHTYQVQLLL